MLYMKVSLMDEYRPSVRLVACNCEDAPAPGIPQSVLPLDHADRIVRIEHSGALLAVLCCRAAQRLRSISPLIVPAEEKVPWCNAHERISAILNQAADKNGGAASACACAFSFVLL